MVAHVGAPNIVQIGRVRAAHDQHRGRSNPEQFRPVTSVRRHVACRRTSPVIDAIPIGSHGCGTVIKSDQRGVHRPQGSGCDIGGYGNGDVSVQGLVATPKPVSSGSSLTYVVTVANAGAIDATDVSIQDTLPAVVSFNSAKQVRACAR